MAKRKGNQEEEVLVEVVEQQENTGDFLEKNQRIILGALLAAVVAFGAWFFYNKFVKEPKQLEAIEQMQQAQLRFDQDSFALALTNPGPGYDGFEGIIDNYGGTPAGNTAKYYAGISHLNLGNYQEAIDYLGDFSAKGTVLGITKYGAMADAYGELGQMDQAESNYKKAISKGGNEFLEAMYTKRLGHLYEHQGQTEQARAQYEKVKTDYPKSQAALDIDKYITRLSALK